MSVLLYRNVVCYRLKNDFITLTVLTQTGNFGSLGSSIASLAVWTDLFYMTDVIILIALYVWSRNDWSLDRMRIKKPALILISGLLIFSINLGLAEVDRPQLLKRTFDRNYIVKYIVEYNFSRCVTIQNLHTL